jgi:DNA helicase-2/ATP-dependent DNA helicase PcrA
VRGPVCILAGAGSGKTTTITRRIANQVVTGAFEPQAILAVTFTARAARELRSRLETLGVHGVEARTFHAAAYTQLRALSPEPPLRVLASKAVALRQIANALPKPYRFRPIADLATEVEWAKNRRIGPREYRGSLDGHRPPIPADLMTRVYREYERGKRAKGLVDFEDLLELAVSTYEEGDDARRRFRARYQAFTVDEYQDVNLLQQTLLDLWLGGRDELCAVGDDYQAIYGFTGATPAYLLSLPTRFPDAAVIRLEAGYRSTPQVLDLANRLVPGLGGSQKTLRATRGDGPEPVLRPFRDRAAETAFLVQRIRALHEGGVQWNEMAVLYRVNARSEEYEEALAAADVPYEVRSGRFLERPAARRLLAVLRDSSSPDVAGEVRRAAEAEGLLPALESGLGEYETTRQLDLARLVELAATFSNDEATVAHFVADLEHRFGREAERAGGVHLLTYHRSKGLEFEAVFLPRLEAHELPIRQARGDDEVAEERRLLYVGITRAKRHVTITWTGRPSPFLVELDGRAAGDARTSQTGSPVFDALRDWRRRRAKADGVPAYVVFHDRTLAEIARVRPGTERELATIPGVGPAKLERYAGDVLAALGEHPPG